MIRNLILIILYLLTVTLFAQDIVHKKYQIKRVDKAPSIDGVLDDVAWQNANIATNFVMFRPRSNEPEPDNIKTEVKVIYDDNAIYFGAYLHDDKVNEIPMEFQTRDNFGNADFFGVVLNPQNDGQNQTQFFVMSTGNQNDALVTPNNGEDWSWNAVWKSAVKIVDDGWIVEIKIPYSALRFSNNKVQTWGLNFHRNHRKNRDQYSWNFIDRENGNIAQYDGIITGIENVKPPVRLSFNPFITGVTESYAGKTEFNWSAGLDVKYGLTENFTLDATLIPDFGQVAFDDITLNLGPFEQRFSEQRAFFTEGTDLFNKANLFESRRIGNAPIGISLINEIDTEESKLIKETISDYPSKVDILNIVKISGRTKGGLGIGFLNAITKKTIAQVKTTKTLLDNNNEPVLDENDNQIIETSYRDEVIEPLSNYNVLVLDQQFNKNSSISLMNTNVIRNGKFRDANVTALLYNVKTKNSKYGVDGGIAMSNIYNGNGQKPVTGYEGSIEIGKVNGKHQFDVEVEFIDDKYNKNDLGFMRRNNKFEVSSSYSYRIIEPQGIFNNYGVNFWGYLGHLMKLDKTTTAYQEKSNLYTGNGFGMNFWSTTKKQISFGANVNLDVGNQYDYFETRDPNRFYKLKPSAGFNNWFSSNYAKKLALDFSYYYGFRFNETRSYLSVSFSPRYRINNKLSLRYSLNYQKGINLKGWVDTQDNGDIIFGNRDFDSYTNSLSSSYNFSTKSALSLALRHYWQPVTYDEQFFKLENNGTLTPNSYNENEDINFNALNVDLNFQWEFAPGSQLIALYRNQIFGINRESHLNYTENLDNLFKEDVLNNFSLKLIYYLDYNQVKTWL